ALAKKIVDEPRMVALLGLAGEKSHFVFARSAGVDRNMVELLQSALEFLNSKSGGGRPDLAQGGGPPAGQDRIWQAIARAKERLLDDARIEKECDT
ncbi:MAG: hypothetical protein JXA42_14965, partial [Anaerolineales bacterium]|nr:hypothetical protein [Anaerolineales bacterium]